MKNLSGVGARLVKLMEVERRLDKMPLKGTAPSGKAPSGKAPSGRARTGRKR